MKGQSRILTCHSSRRKRELYKKPHGESNLDAREDSQGMMGRARALDESQGEGGDLGQGRRRDDVVVDRLSAEIIVELQRVLGAVSNLQKATEKESLALLLQLLSDPLTAILRHPGGVVSAGWPPPVKSNGQKTTSVPCSEPKRYLQRYL